jgi:hypothetical protein
MPQTLTLNFDCDMAGGRSLANHHCPVALPQRSKDSRLQVDGPLPGSLKGFVSYQRLRNLPRRQQGPPARRSTSTALLNSVPLQERTAPLGA